MTGNETARGQIHANGTGEIDDVVSRVDAVDQHLGRSHLLKTIKRNVARGIRVSRRHVTGKVSAARRAEVRPTCTDWITSVVLEPVEAYEWAAFAQIRTICFRRRNRHWGGDLVITAYQTAA